MRAGFAKAIARIHGTGRHWRDWWVFRQAEAERLAVSWRRHWDSILAMKRKELVIECTACYHG